MLSIGRVLYKESLKQDVLKEIKGKMKKSLPVTDGIFHPPYFGRVALEKSLAELDGFEFQNVRLMEKLPANLKDFSALVIYIPITSEFPS